MPRRFVLLSLVATLAVAIAWAAWTAYLDRRGGAVSNTVVTAHFSPNSDGTADEASVQWKNGTRTVEAVHVVSATGKTVVSLTPALLDNGHHGVFWDGRTDGDVRAPDGRYSLALTFTGGADHRVALPSHITLDTVAPDVEAWMVGRAMSRTSLLVKLRALAQEPVNLAARNMCDAAPEQFHSRSKTSRTPPGFLYSIQARFAKTGAACNRIVVLTAEDAAGNSTVMRIATDGSRRERA